MERCVSAPVKNKTNYLCCYFRGIFHPIQGDFQQSKVVPSKYIKVIYILAYFTLISNLGYVRYFLLYFGEVK